MTTSNGLLFFEDEGCNCYSQGYDNPLLQFVGVYIKQAVDYLDTSLSDGTPFTLADYGTADGGWFLTNLPAMIGAIRKKLGDDRDIMCILEDLPYNDFKSVWMNAKALGSLTGVYFATSTVSFYGQCLPKNSLHLGVTTAATQWLSNCDFVPQDTMCPNTSNDPQTVKSAANLSDQDWEQFLLSRCAELVKGGVLLCCNFGIEDDVTKSVWLNFDLNPLDRSWNQLHEDGVISQEEFARGGVPFLLRTEQQHKKPFVNKDSLVYKAGLRLMHFENKYLTCLQKDKEMFEGKVTPENEQEVLDLIAQKRTNCGKVLYSSHVYKALNPDRTDSEQEEIVRLFFEHYRDVMRENKSVVQFPDDIQHHIMIIRKE